MTSGSASYPARLDIDYTEERDRLTTFVRLIWAIPIVVIFSLLSAATSEVATETGDVIARSGGITSGLFLATMLMIVFRQRYPHWWFDFARELARFSARVLVKPDSAFIRVLVPAQPDSRSRAAIKILI